VFRRHYVHSQRREQITHIPKEFSSENPWKSEGSEKMELDIFAGQL
jgi:hypothetical protein